MPDSKNTWISELVSRPRGCPLSDAVVATQMGLEITDDALLKYLLNATGARLWLRDDPEHPFESEHRVPLLLWEEIGEWLRYPGHGPWALVPNQNRGDGTKAGPIICGTKPKTHQRYRLILRRFAAQIADDGVAFRVLHYCVMELGGAP